MGRQLNFYAEEEILNKFIEYFFNQGFVIVAEDLDNKKLVTFNKISEVNSKIHSMFLYKKDYGNLYTKDWCEYRIEYFSSPVIEFTKSAIKPEEKLIIRGRVWMESKYYDQDGSIIAKDERLTKDFNAIVRMIKKNIPCRNIKMGKYIYKEYITDRVNEILNNGYKLY